MTPARSMSGFNFSHTASMVSATASMPRSDNAEGSTTTRAKSAAAKPVVVIQPSEGAQSTSTSS